MCQALLKEKKERQYNVIEKKKEESKMKKQEMLTKKAKSEKNYQELINKLEASGYKYHHSAYARGYVSRVSYPDVMQYAGKYGRGVKVLLPSRKSTRYAVAEYYIQTEDQDE